MAQQLEKPYFLDIGCCTGSEKKTQKWRKYTNLYQLCTPRHRFEKVTIRRIPKGLFDWNGY